LQYLVLGAKARAVLGGTLNVSCDHVRDVAPIVLRHRVLTNFTAEAEGIDADQIVSRLLKMIPEA
jgi:MoxR-like ATPase